MRRTLTRTFLQSWWRLSRGLTLGVRAIVADEKSRVLLVKHTYVPGWHLPGGGVERGETMATALERELREEANIALDGPARLHGIFSSGKEFPGDHVAVFIAGDWRQNGPKAACREIVAAEFFAPSELPDDVTAATRRRLAEVFDGADLSETW